MVDETKHNASFDTLRTFAAIIVIAIHPSFPTLFPIDFLHKGSLAVDFFFVLSGYVIALTYTNKTANPRNALHFLGARFARIYPLYSIVLSIWVLVEL